MNCEEAEGIMMEHLYGEPAGALDVHLQSCPGCARKLRQYSETVRGLGPRGDLVEPPQRVLDNVLSLTSSSRPAAWKYAAATALAAGVLLAAALALRQNEKGKAPSAPPIAASQPLGLRNEYASAPASQKTPASRYKLEDWMTYTPANNGTTENGKSVWDKWPAKS